VEKANNPSPMLYHLKRGREFEEQGELDKAINEALLAMDANPKSTKPIRELGYYYFLKDDLEEAESWLKKAADMNALDVFAVHYLGEIYLKMKNIEKAVIYLEKAMAISPRHLERGINFAKTLVRMKAVPKAIQIFDKTLELAGSTLELREEIADFCIENDVNKYAVTLLESIVGEKPNRPDVLFKMAQALEKSGEIKRAIFHLVRANEIDKENIDIKIHLAKDYLMINKPILAETPLKEIIKLNPDNELAKELLKECI
jgi:tetratricopeptide (TPR) repeat protein